MGYRQVLPLYAPLDELLALRDAAREALRRTQQPADSGVIKLRVNQATGGILTRHLALDGAAASTGLSKVAFRFKDILCDMLDETNTYRARAEAKVGFENLLA